MNIMESVDKVEHEGENEENMPSTNTNDNKKETKSMKKKRKKKNRRQQKKQETNVTATDKEDDHHHEPDEDVEIEYITDDGLSLSDPNYRHFVKVFEAFKMTDPSADGAEENPVSVSAKSSHGAKKNAKDDDSDEEEQPKKDDGTVKLSKKKMRRLNRMSVAQLKQLVDRPDLVEMHDVAAHDPQLLVYLKSTKNSVPVPRHWCFKRKYLQGKRGIEKSPFQLPEFIKATGIMEMRTAVDEKEDQKSLKQKTRERVRPKMGKLTIDYQKLHDAFFRWQTKPSMTIHGDLYYEGKEFETRLKDRKPGDLSDDLRMALGMPIGPGKNKFPPPWLIAMQRYGPPPSYPHLKIPGLNAPIPDGCSFGYFVGGWGKPPVDEIGRPLYGDVFGMQNEGSGFNREVEVDETLWGELESSEEEEEDESEDEQQPEKDMQAGMMTPMEGLVTPSGLTSIPAGLETPEMIQLRKKKIEEQMEQSGEAPSLYTVLPEKNASVGASMMGSSHVYDMGGAAPITLKKGSAVGLGEGVDISLDPSELELDSSAMTQKYEEKIQQVGIEKEDLSDMVAEHAARQKIKRKKVAEAQASKSSSTKKLKEFKF